MAERSGIHVTGKDSGWPVAADTEPDPHKDGSGVDDLPKVEGVAKGVVTAGEEVQEVADEGGDAATTFTLTFSGQTTSALNRDTATAGQVETALVALSNIAPADIDVTGPTGGPWAIRFLEDGAYGGVNVPAITGTGIGVNEIQTVTITGEPVGGNFKLSFGGAQTTNLKHNATGAEVQTALRALATIADDEISVAGNGPYVCTFAAGLGGKDVAALTADGSGLTGGTAPAVAVTTGTPGKVGPTVVVETLAQG
jgi:hypothetical protein